MDPGQAAQFGRRPDYRLPTRDACDTIAPAHVVSGALVITGGGRGIGAARLQRVFATNAIGAVLWLLSDEASFTTGAFIDVTGGT